MIKEALEYILEISGYQTTVIDGQTYSSKRLIQVLPKEYDFDCLHLHTLDGFLEYSLHLETAGPRFIAILSHNEVALYKNRDDKNQIEQLALAHYHPNHSVTTFTSSEMLIQYLQTAFEDSENRRALERVIGNVKSSIVHHEKDDGITQTVEIQKGISLIEKADIPNPITLKPFITFPEIDPIERPYVVRARKSNDAINWLLTPSESDNWQLEIINKIREYLKKAVDPGWDIYVIG